MTKKTTISAEAFVIKWQQAKDLDSFIKETGMTEQSAQTRAFNYRKKGVPLKKFKSRRKSRVNWDKLKQIAENVK